MRRRLVPLSTAVLTVAVLTGCGGPLPGTGPRRGEDRSISDVTAVELDTPGTMIVTAGAAPRLRITAPSDVLAHLTSRVAGGVLVLGADRSRWRSGEIRYDLVVPRLDGVTVNGSGNATLTAVPGSSVRVTVQGSGGVMATGVDAEDLTARAAGSGNITVAGRAARQDVTILGSGDYHAPDLASETASIRVVGSGSADVRVSGQLHAEVTGSGDITYSGNPTVEKRVSGSGEVSPG